DGRIVGLANHTVLIARDGTERPIDDSAAPIRSKRGEVVGCVLVFRDVTDRRAAEARVQAERDRVQLVADAVPALISYIDADGRYRLNNRAYEAWFGHPRGDLAGRHMRDVLGEAAWAAIRPHVDAALAGRVVTYEAEVPYRDGGTRWILATYTPDVGADGRARGFVAHVADVSPLKRAERQLATTLECISDGFMRFDRDWRVVYVNAEGERLCGMNRADLIGRGHWELFPASVGTRVDVEYRRAVAEHVTVEFENYYEPTGRWFAIKGFPTADGGLAVYYQDVTARKEAEATLRRSEERFRRAADAVNGIIYEFDLPTGRVERTRGLTEVTGYLPGEVPPTSAWWWEQVHPDDRARIRQEFAQVSGETVLTEYRVRHRDGRWLHVEDRAVVTRDGDGKPVRLVGCTMDVTARRQAEADRAREREQLALALHSAGLGVYEWEVGTDAVWWSPELYPVFGVDPATFRPTVAAFSALVHPDDREELWRKTEECLATGEVFAHEYRIVPPDGPARWVFNRSRVTPGPAGRPARITGVAMDVTARRAAEDRLRADDARHAFLVRLTDALRPLSDPVAVQAEAARVLGTHLGVGHAYYAEILADDETVVVAADYAAGLPSVAGRYRFADFAPELKEEYRAGRTVVIDDVRSDLRVPAELRQNWAALGIGAQVGVPLVKGGRFAVVLGVDQSGPRAWSAAEVSLIEDTAERTWAAVERAKAEAGLRESEERAAFVRRASGVGFWYCDLPFDVLLWDDRVKAHFHLPPDAHVTIDTFYARIHPADREPTRRAIEHSIRDRAGYDVYYRTVHPESGAEKWVRAIGRTFYAPDGAPTRFDGITLDVTDQRRAEAAVRASEERFRTLFETMDEGFCVIEFLDGPHGPLSDYVHVLANPAFTANAGIPNIVGRKVREMVPDEAGAWVEVYRTVLLTGRPVRFERELVATGRHLDLAAFRIEPPERRQVAVLFQDVTARKRAEEALREADRRKDEFLATLAHELRNPLAPLRNGLQLLKMAGGDAELAERSRGMMDRQLTQLVRLVDDLLDVSRITRGKIELRPEQVDLRAVIESAIETVRPVIEQSGHRLTVSAPDGPLVVTADPTRLAQVVANLLTNSAKYTHPGGHIRLTVGRDGGTAVVSVVDDGIGIPPGMLDRVFEMFTQVDRTLEKTTGGLGIGLSLVKGLVEMHGGTIAAHSDGEGKGSEFVVRLPIRDPV
ncbi:MAG TPA: PAS domain S-box protein, partial [Gemmataceae bacterium]|nr:PAS domain S-box protein [Gemmataceae bacterium]